MAHVLVAVSLASPPLEATGVVSDRVEATVAVPDGDAEGPTEGDIDAGGAVVAGVAGVALRRTTTMRPHIPQFEYVPSLPWIRQ